ncbi:MAG: hypothetical protein Q8P90_05095 [bacterium]|nr:hypothetical protein [bacterium]
MKEGIQNFIVRDLIQFAVISLIAVGVVASLYVYDNATGNFSLFAQKVYSTLLG